MAEERLQRRLAAILSADVVGYSRLIGLDEAGTISRLNALRRGLIDPMIAAHAGRIVKLMGDGALVEFASRRGRHHGTEPGLVVETDQSRHRRIWLVGQEVKSFFSARDEARRVPMTTQAARD